MKVFIIARVACMWETVYASSDTAARTDLLLVDADITAAIFIIRSSWDVTPVEPIRGDKFISHKGIKLLTLDEARDRTPITKNMMAKKNKEKYMEEMEAYNLQTEKEEEAESQRKEVF
ncbi:high mobility group B protein 13-like protein [Corchorus capsularis]|uniref:High mobility group B protein 13-like protein n=1 Tax=Corchorus capsularis TaxID=210143 RepID=A0A1R3J433_COCAP|nr:high mobility group B protein 13-like protein [Corchorus capsularis]